jgi:hypothetical protein
MPYQPTRRHFPQTATNAAAGLGLGKWAGPTVRCLKSSTTIAIVWALGSRSQGELVSANSD